MNGREETEWVITLHTSGQKRIDAVVAELQACGMHVDKVLRSLGQIIGHGDASCAEAAAGLADVSSVDLSYQHRLAPPDSDIQ